MREAEAVVAAARRHRRLAAGMAALLSAGGLGLLPSPASAAPVALSGHAVQALAWFGGAAYAGTDAGLYRLGPSGWSAVAAVPPTRTVQALVASGAVLYAGTDTGVIRSGDETVWAAAGLSGQRVDSLDAAGGALFAGTGHDGSQDGVALRSDDGGATWAPAVATPAAEGLPGPPVQAIVGPTGGQLAFAGTAGSGVFGSHDGRGSWTGGYPGMRSGWVTSLWRASAPADVFAGTDDGLYQWGGVGPWTPVAFPQPDPWVQAITSADGDSPIVGTYDGDVVQDTPGGWRTLASGLPSVLSLLAVPAAGGGGVLAGTFDGVACIGCAPSVGAAGAAPTARPGATPLPPAAQRPGASTPAPPPGVAQGSPAAAPTVPAAHVGAPGATAPGGGGIPLGAWIVAGLLLALSGGVLVVGMRRSRG